jgi:hypothetical protein
MTANVGNLMATFSLKMIFNYTVRWDEPSFSYASARICLAQRIASLSISVPTLTHYGSRHLALYPLISRSVMIAESISMS